MTNLTQADWIHGSPARKTLFARVCATLNYQVGKLEFEVEDGASGPFIHHIPTEIWIGLRPSMPANPAKPFDLWVRLKYRFPVRADGSFNAELVVKRVKEVRQLRLPEVP